MISVFFEYHNPVCDGCGMMLGADKSDEDARETMRQCGWLHDEDGRDYCRLCQLRRAEAQKNP